MLPAERQEMIVQYVNENDFISFAELMGILQVSKPTIVRDLIKLEKLNLIVRTYGGARSINKGTRFEPRHVIKETQAIAEKRKIASLAFDKFIHPGETVLLDSGSTTFLLAKKLRSIKNLTVITNDIKIAMLLCDNEEIELVVLGGQRRKGVYSLTGPLTENALQNLNVDKTFLGMDAIDVERGITNSNIEETNLKKMMIDLATETILLLDSSKFQTVAFSKIANLNVLDVIITDDKLKDESVYENIVKQGVDLQIAR